MPFGSTFKGKEKHIWGNQHLPLQEEKSLLIPLLVLILSLLFAEAVQGQELIWAKRAGGGSHDSGSDIVVVASGNSYVTGDFHGSITFEAGEANETLLNSAGSFDIFMAKYDADGMLLWAKQDGGSDVDQGFSIATDASGDSYITGIFEGVATFGAGEANETTLTSAGSRDIFIARYNTNGMLLWAKRAGGVNSNDHGLNIVVDPSGNSYVTGFFNASATFGAGETNETSLSSAGSFDIFMAKYDSDGLLLWAKRAGGGSSDFGDGIGLDASGNSYVTGSFEESVTFGAGEANETALTGAGASDIFMAKYDDDGLLLWAKRAGGGFGDFGAAGIGLDASGNSYATGQFSGSATFGADEANETVLTSAGASDIFVAKYGVGSPTSVDETSILIDDFKLAQNYPNPFNPATMIFFESPKAGAITLAIYNLRGQLVRALVSGEALPGRHHVTWDGTDNNGRDVASGIYIYKLNAGEFTATKKMILLQ